MNAVEKPCVYRMYGKEEDHMRSSERVNRRRSRPGGNLVSYPTGEDITFFTAEVLVDKNRMAAGRRGLQLVPIQIL